MITILKTNPTVRMLCDYIKGGEMTFDNPIQRGFVWKRDKKSLLIHSIIFGYPIPPIYANKNENIFDILDGQQRCKTIYQFVNNNKFSLSVVPPFKFDNGEILELTVKKFEGLPTKIQNLLLSYNLDLHYGIDLTTEQIKEMFIRLNNGKPLSATELTKAQIASVGEVIKLANHKIFLKLMNEDAKEASKNISFVMQAYTILFSENKCLLNSSIKQKLKTNKISSIESKIIGECFDIYDTILENITTEKSDINKKVILVLKRKVHFVFIIPVVKYIKE